MREFTATIWYAPHDERGFQPTVKTRIKKIRAMNWLSALKKVRKALDQNKLPRSQGYEIQIAESRGQEPSPDCWMVN